MTNLYTKDSLRAAVESHTDGNVTILYDDKGFPNYMCVIPKFKVASIDITSEDGVTAGDYLGSPEAACEGYHPAFAIYDPTTSEVTIKDEIFVGMYLASSISSRALSLPGKVPSTSVTLSQARTLTTSKGTGWHLMTNWEFSAIALQVYKKYGNLRGNDSLGRSFDVPGEFAVRKDGYIPGETPFISGDSVSYTGSGPMAWRHNKTLSGIDDFCGNLRTWVDGVRINDGQYQFKGSADYNVVATDASWVNGGVWVDAPATFSIPGVNPPSGSRWTIDTRDPAYIIAADGAISSRVGNPNYAAYKEWSISGSDPGGNRHSAAYLASSLRFRMRQAGLDASELTTLDDENSPKGLVAFRNDSNQTYYFLRGGASDYYDANGLFAMITYGIDSTSPFNGFRVAYVG